MTLRTRPTLDLDTARAQIAAAALVDGPIGTVGLELERIVVDARDPGRDIAWREICGAVGGLGPMPAGSQVTLEPGGQVELSTAPAPDAAAAVAALRDDSVVLQQGLAAAGLTAIAVGTDPLRPRTHRHDGPRYAAMAQGFAAAGYADPAATMMCSSASLQVNLDAGPRAGWSQRVTTVHALGPVLTAMSACSPWLAGRDTGWASARMQAWQALDPGRTAPYAGWGGPADAWANFALAAPVLAVVRGERCVPVLAGRRVPMVDWLTGRVRLAGRRPTAEDLALHLTMLWPPLRLRGFLEIRALDAVPDRWWPGLAALVVAMVDGAPDAVLAACAPVATRWEMAARDGLADPALLRAARACLEAALPYVPGSLAAQAHAYADLIDSGRTPGDLLAADIAAHGVGAALLEAGQ